MTKATLARHREMNIADQNRKATTEHLEQLHSLIMAISTSRARQGRDGIFLPSFVKSVQDELSRMRAQLTRATVR
jgi:chemotaxis receptor (MCP) glutamine deamidase CheD